MSRVGAAGTGQPSKAEQARQVTEEALAALAEQLEAGNSAQLDAYLKAMARFHTYSFGNIMLILAQKPEATRVAGFHTWRGLNRAVKRGEKGIAIFAPMLLKPKEEDEDDKPRLRFRVVHVFDVSQTEGEALPEPARVGGDPGAALAKLEEAVVGAGITLETLESLGGADGQSSGGRIVLRAGLSPAERFSVLVHEWAHEILHQKTDPKDRPPKTVRETEAEAVAFVVGEAVGLDTNTAASDYIRVYRGDAKTLDASMTRIQQAACAVIEAILSDRSKSRQRAGLGHLSAKAR